MLEQLKNTPWTVHEKMRWGIIGNNGSGKTILLASHNQSDIEKLCDTVCEMESGIMTIIR